MAMSLYPSESTVVVKKSKKGLVKNYIQDLLALGEGEETNNKNGIRINISEEEFTTLDIPLAEDEVRSNIFKTEYTMDNGFTGHSLYVMNRANPKKASIILQSIGLPGPKQARLEVEEAEDDYPDYD